ncbi:MAG: sigma-54-dependent Fis family transcriptional regulator, partial [Kiritimatiellae bacterium]|nr:sigma-54-dependent Fis family transcriptional regulator [Kiritimatiellia bacterium]
NVVTLAVPPLRERRADIRPMSDRFIARAASENGKTIVTVRPDFYEALEGYAWPGNVRQLRNVVESAVLLSTDGILTADSLSLPGRTRPAASPDGLVVPEGMTLEAMERAVLESRLRANNGNRTVTAEQLGLSRRTIQRKIKEHRLPF